MDAIHRVLLVEGKNDSYVVSALLNSIGAQVKTKKGRSDRDPTVILELKGEANIPVRLRIVGDGIRDVLRKLPIESKESGLESLAAIVDANSDFEARWNEIKHCLQIAGCLNLPQSPAKSGFISRTENGLRVGVWIMPNNADRGMLEDFLINLIPDDDKLLLLVKQFVGGIPLEVCPFKNESKASLRTWLALQREPESTFGQAVDQRLFDLSKPSCEKFIAWLRKLLMVQPAGSADNSAAQS